MARESIGEILTPIRDSELPLQSVYRWEKERPDSLYLVQPLGGGRVDRYTWDRTLDEARRLAAYLQIKGYAPGTKIAMVSKNAAHHFIFELAIWTAGQVSVSVFPTVDGDTPGYILEHAECPLLFAGKLDAWAGMASGVPGSVEILSCALSPKIEGATRWEDVLQNTEPMSGHPERTADDTAILVYTSGSTGKPKGVIHTFESSSVTALDEHDHRVLQPRPNALVPATRPRHGALVVVPVDSWEIADGLLTPTMKIKRSAIEERYDASAKALGSGVVALS